jgi:hypothetical protein
MGPTAKRRNSDGLDRSNLDGRREDAGSPIGLRLAPDLGKSTRKLAQFWARAVTQLTPLCRDG